MYTTVLSNCCALPQSQQSRMPLAQRCRAGRVNTTGTYLATHWFEVGGEGFQQEVSPDGVYGGDNDVSKPHAGVHHVLWEPAGLYMCT